MVRASGTKNGGIGVFIQVALLSMPLPVLLKWASTLANLTAQCCCGLTLHTLFFREAQEQRPFNHIYLQSVSASGI